jgi:hypothetical protein
MTVVQVDDEDRIGNGAYLPRASSGSPDGKTPASDVALSPEHTRQVSPLRNVALRGKMTADGYIPENWSWMMGRVDSRGELRRIGRDPPSAPSTWRYALELDLSDYGASGHSQRPTRVLVRSIETVEYVERDRHRIDPATAEVMWEYGYTLDPYGVHELLDEEKQIGRAYFARSPGSDVWVSFYDLPDATAAALWDKHSSKLAFPAGLFGIR